jgi:F-type H+-transporting ATPase subunit b
MLIDWFTVGAQILNFLVLIWLMKRFLYKPILNAIDSREKATAATIADAEAKKSAAEKEHAEYDQKNKEFDENRAALLAKATSDAKALSEQLAIDAKQNANDLSAKLQASLQAQEESLKDAVSHRVQKEVFAIAHQALKDLAGVDLASRMVDSFVRELQNLDPALKAKLMQAASASKNPVNVRSANSLDADLRARVESAIKKQFGESIEMRFQTKPDLIGGIELDLNGQKIAWTFAEYLNSLENGIVGILKSKSAPPPHGN